MQRVESLISRASCHNVKQGDLQSHDKRAPSLRQICCIGGGYVGGPSGIIIANKAPDTKVTVVDVDPERIDAWNSDQLPVHEPGLLDLVTIARDGIAGREPNLFFSTEIDHAIRDADLILVSVNTPTKISGTGTGRASDLGWLETAIRRIAQCAEHDTVVVLKSTVPCGTAENMQEILQANAKPDVNFEVLSNPEFLAEGRAVSNLLYPDRVIIGHCRTDTGRAAAEKLANIYATWVPRDQIIIMNVCSAELSKLASNALLAQRISSINALSAICELTGADIEEVSYACGLDSRIGPSMLSASVGFGGSCFRKDILNLSCVSTGLNLPEVAAYWESIVDMNEYQKERFIHKIVSTMHSTLSKKKVAVLGFAFKKNTSDTRESPAIHVVKSLLAENAIVAIFDPQVQCEQILRDLNTTGPSESLRICSNPYEACENAHAVIILTEWDMFSNKPLVSRQTDTTTIDTRILHDSTDDSEDLTMSSGNGEDDNGSDCPKDSCKETPAKLGQILECSVETTADPVLVYDPNGDDSGATAMKMTPQLTRPGEYRLDWSRVATLMQRPMHVFDGRNVIDAYDLMRLGFHVQSIGSILPPMPYRSAILV